jgi:hypothetical protein
VSGIFGFNGSATDKMSLLRKSIGYHHDVSTDVPGSLAFAPRQLNDEVYGNIFPLPRRYFQWLKEALVLQSGWL